MSDRIVELVTRVIEEQGFEIVKLRNNPATRIRAWIDRDPEGVTIKDCTDLSRSLRDAFEREGLDPGDYAFEIQSPGVDRLLAREKDFVRFAGQQVKVRLHEKRPELARKNFTGQLVGLEEGEVVVDGDDTWRFGLDEIEEARLVPRLPFGDGGDQGKPKRGRNPRKAQRKRPKQH